MQIIECTTCGALGSHAFLGYHNGQLLNGMSDPGASCVSVLVAELYLKYLGGEAGTCRNVGDRVPYKF